MSERLVYVKRISGTRDLKSPYVRYYPLDFSRYDHKTSFRHHGGNGGEIKWGDSLMLDAVYYITLGRIDEIVDIEHDKPSCGFKRREEAPEWDKLCGECALLLLGKCEGFKNPRRLAAGQAIMHLSGEEAQELVNEGTVGGEEPNCGNLAVQAGLKPRFE